MGKKKEYKEANRRFLKNLSFQEGFLHCRVASIIKYWRPVKVRFLRVRGALFRALQRKSD